MATETPGLMVPVGVNTKGIDKGMAEAVAKTERGMRKITAEYIKANPGSPLAKLAAKNADAAQREFNRHERSITRLKTSLDPAYAAQKRYESAVRQVEAAVRMGAVSQKDANGIMEMARARHLQAGGAARANAVAQRGLFNVSNAGRFVLQNTTSQVADMAVQMEMGTNPMRIMGQQLPQVFGGFAALGGVLGTVAPLLGVIAAIGFPVAAFLMTAGDNAEDSAEKVKDFADAFDKAEAAINRANSAISRAADGDLDSLREAYGEVNSEIQNLIETLAKLELEKALVAAGAQVDQFFSDNAMADDMLAQVEERQEMVARLRDELAQLQDPNRVNFGMMGGVRDVSGEIAGIRSEIERLESLDPIGEKFEIDPAIINGIRSARDAMEEAMTSGDPTQMLDAIVNYRRVLEAIPGGPLADMGDELAYAEDLLRKALNQSQRLEDSSGRINFDGAASSASRMADEISRAADAMYELRAQGLTDLESAQIRYQYKDDPVGRAGALAGAEFDRRVDPLAQTLGPTAGTQLAREREAVVANAAEVARLNEASRPARRSSGSGRRSGGGSRSSRKEDFDLFANSEREITALERQIEMVGKSRREVVALTAKYELLDAAKEKGIDLDQRSAETGRTLRDEIDLQAEAIANLTIEAEQYAAQADVMADLNQDLKDGLIDAIVEGKNFGEVLENVAKQLAKAALQAALFGDGPMAGLFGGGGGLLGGLFGGGGLKFFARGTNYAPGGAAVVGEEGPELVHLPRGSKVIPNHKLGQGGSATLHVSVGVDESGNLQPFVEQVSGNVAVNVSGQMISENNRQVSQMQRR